MEFCTEVASLLEEYADYLVGDLCFQLRFESDFRGQQGAQLVMLLTSVVQHAGVLAGGGGSDQKFLIGRFWGG